MPFILIMSREEQILKTYLLYSFPFHFPIFLIESYLLFKENKSLIAVFLKNDYNLFKPK